MPFSASMVHFPIIMLISHSPPRLHPLNLSYSPCLTLISGMVINLCVNIRCLTLNLCQELRVYGEWRRCKKLEDGMTEPP